MTRSKDQKYLLGIDTGGTFTDFILIKPDKKSGNIELLKVLSTPHAPEEAILKGIDELGLNDKLDQLRIIHGTTVATNAALESKGVKTAFITNRGFADLLTIGRQARGELYNLQPKPVPPPVSKEFCIETGGRLNHKGEELEPLTELDLNELEQKIRALNPDAVAINLLFSFLDDSYERRIEERLKPLAYVCRSSLVLPEMREYERGIATWYNAYLGPLVADYFNRLKAAVSPAPVSIMQSSGGTIAIDQAAEKTVNLLLSGPAGGLAAAAYMGQQKNSSRMLTFDMGGTSTDVAMVNGSIKLTSEGRIGRYPVAVPMVDMHTIGAGGGSIAYLDDAGMLHVGPESAGAQPGPACYGKGGTRPTVTDANAVLGRLQADNFLGGNMSLDKARAVDALAGLAERMNLNVEECATGIIDLANEHMSQALRVISERRGHDPAHYQLVGFGGAGGLHICALADAMGTGRALVPVYGGVFSAFGMLVAPRSRELSHSCLKPLAEFSGSEADEKFASLTRQAVTSLKHEGLAESQIHIKKSILCRYVGQSFTLNVDWNNTKQVATAFHHAHKSSYGHNFDLPVEVVSLRLSAISESRSLALEEFRHNSSDRGATEKPVWIKNNSGQIEERLVTIYQREVLPVKEWVAGPVLICETSATIWLDPGWRVKRDDPGNLELEKTEAP